MSIRSKVTISVLMVLGLGIIPQTPGLVTGQITNPLNTFASASVYSPTGLSGAWNGRGVALTWTAPVRNNGNGYVITALNNVGNPTCPTTSATYGILVGSTAALTFTDTTSRVVAFGIGDYACYLVRSAYNPAGPPPWGSTPQWASSDTLPTVSVPLTITHVQNVCVVGSGTTLTATFAGPVAARDLLVGNFGAPIGAMTVSDNINGAWSLINNVGADHMFYLANSKSAAANGLTITLSAVSGTLRICADEFAGVATTNALDQNTAVQTAAGAAWQAPTTPSTAGGQLVYAGVAALTNSATLTAGTTNGVAMIMAGQVTTGTLGTGGAAYALGSVAGAQNSTMTMAPPTNPMAGIQATFWPRAIMQVQTSCAVGTGTSLTTTYAGGGGVASGDLLVGVFTGNAPLGVSDNVNGAWTLVNSSGTTSLYYRENTAAAAPNALTVTLTGATGPLRMCGSEFAGTLATGSLDRNTAGAGAASPWQAPATAAIPIGELVFAGVSTAANTNTLGAGSTNGVVMTLASTSTSAANGTVGVESALSGAAGAQNSTMTLTPSAAATGVQATFLAGCTVLCLDQTGLLRVTQTQSPVATQILVDGQIADSWGLNWLKQPSGDHTVCFTHVEGWTEPACQTVTVTAGNTTTVAGTFIQRGELQVITAPAVASQISVDGNPTDDSSMWTDVPTGSHTVCFGAVAGYNPPACQTAIVTAGAQTTITGTFTSNPSAPGQSGMGLLRVTTSPGLASQITITPGAGSPYIADSWGLNWLGLTPGSYTVSFSHVQGYTEPAPQTVTVTANITTTVTGTFTQRGTLKVSTSPSVAGTILVDGVLRDDYGMFTDIPTGSHTVCFLSAPGYANTPACQMATVTAGTETDVTGTYS